MGRRGGNCPAGEAPETREGLFIPENMVLTVQELCQMPGGRPWYPDLNPTRGAYTRGGRWTPALQLPLLRYQRKTTNSEGFRGQRRT